MLKVTEWQQRRDTGGAIKGNKIDVFVAKKSDANNWGVRTVNVKVLD